MAGPSFTCGTTTTTWMESLDGIFDDAEIVSVEKFLNLFGLLSVETRVALTKYLPDWDQDRRDLLWQYINQLAPSIPHPMANIGATWPCLRRYVATLSETPVSSLSVFESSLGESFRVMYVFLIGLCAGVNRCRNVFVDGDLHHSPLASITVMLENKPARHFPRSRRRTRRRGIT